MADTTLSPTGLVEIEVGASENTWGTKLNDNFALINTLLTGLATGVQNFTPTMTTDGVVPTGVTYTTQSGKYVDLGAVIVAQVTMVLSNKGTGGTGQVRVAGFPGTALVRASATMAHNENTTGVSSGSFVCGLMGPAANYVGMRLQGPNSSTTLDWSAITNTWQVIFTLIYIKT